MKETKVFLSEKQDEKLDRISKEKRMSKTGYVSNLVDKHLSKIK